MIRDLTYYISPFRRKINREIRKLVPEINEAGIKVLELGCGKNSYKRLCPESDWLATDVKKYIGVDEVADITNLKYADNSFDYVFCLSVLEHVFETEKAISELKRVLKKGGKLILVVPFFFPLHDIPHDYWRFSEYALEKLFRDFTLIKQVSCNFFHNRLTMGYFSVYQK